MLTEAWWRKNEETSWAKISAEEAGKLYCTPVESTDARFRCPVCSRYLAFQPGKRGQAAYFFHENPEMDKVCEKKLSEQQKPKESSASAGMLFRVRKTEESFQLDLGLPPLSAASLKAAADSGLQIRLMGQDGNLERYIVKDPLFAPEQITWLELPDDWFLTFRLMFTPDNACPKEWRITPELPSSPAFFDGVTGEYLADQTGLLLSRPYLMLIQKVRFAPPEGIEIVRCGKGQNGWYLYTLRAASYTAKNASYLERQFGVELRTETTPKPCAEVVWPPVIKETDDSLTTDEMTLWFYLSSFRDVCPNPDKSGEIVDRIDLDACTSFVQLKRRKKLESLTFSESGSESSKTLAFLHEDKPSRYTPRLSLFDKKGIPISQITSPMQLPPGGIIQVLSEVDGKAEIADAPGAVASVYLPAGQTVSISSLTKSSTLTLRQGLDTVQVLMFEEKALSKREIRQARKAEAERREETAEEKKARKAEAERREETAEGKQVRKARKIREAEDLEGSRDAVLARKKARKLRRAESHAAESREEKANESFQETAETPQAGPETPDTKTNQAPETIEPFQETAETPQAGPQTQDTETDQAADAPETTDEPFQETAGTPQADSETQNTKTDQAADAPETTEEPVFFHADTLYDFMSDDPDWQEYQQSGPEPMSDELKPSPMPASVSEPAPEETAEPESESARKSSQKAKAESGPFAEEASTMHAETVPKTDTPEPPVPEPTAEEKHASSSSTRSAKKPAAFGPKPAADAPGAMVLPAGLWRGRMVPFPKRYAWIFRRLSFSTESFHQLENAFRAGQIPAGVLAELEKAVSKKRVFSIPGNPW